MKKTEFDYLSKNYDNLLKNSIPTVLEEVNYFYLFGLDYSVANLVISLQQYSFVLNITSAI